MRTRKISLSAAAAAVCIITLASLLSVRGGGEEITHSGTAFDTETAVRGRIRFTTRWTSGQPIGADCYPAVTLKDSGGYIAAVFVDDACSLKGLDTSGRSQSWEMRLPDILPGGNYGVYLSVGDITGTPQRLLAAQDIPRDLRYPIGEVAISGDYGVHGVGASYSAGILTLTLRYTAHSQIPSACSPLIELHNTDGWQTDLPNMYTPYAMKPYYTDWSAAKRNELNTSGYTQITVRTSVTQRNLGKSYEIYAGMSGTDEISLQGDQGRMTLIGVLDITENGEAAVRGL